MSTTATSSYVNSTCPRVQLVVSTSSTTGGSATYSWTLKYVVPNSSYTMHTSNTKTVTAKINGSTVYSSAVTVGYKTSFTIATGTKTISKTTSSQTISISVSIAWGTATWSGTTLNTRSGSASFTLAAKTSYTISYNANGGSGAPSSQTKWYGTTLTLSTTTPSRTGYTFKGWATSSTGSVAYAAGGSYTANAAATLYAIWSVNTYTITLKRNTSSSDTTSSAQTKTYGTSLTLKTISTLGWSKTGYTFQGWGTSSSTTTVKYSNGASYTSNSAATLYGIWKANTYTVSYNANGGSGAPSSQTKTYGVTLVLSSTKPTRTNYTFQGWATSSSGSVAYAAGANYTNNSAVTLYAVWKLNYTKPTISSLTVSRCDSSGTLDDEGTCCKIVCKWSCSQIGGDNYAASLSYQVGSYSSVSVALSSTTLKSSTTTAVYTTNALSTETSYTVKFTVTDTIQGGSTTSSTTLAAYKYPLDIRYDGTGVGIGRPASYASRLLIYYNTVVSSSGKQYVTDGLAGTVIQNGSIELSASTPYIDFHYANSTSDYTQRISATSSSGNLVANPGISASSDERLKQDIVDIPDVYVDLFDAITPREYRLVNGNGLRLGVVAQEVLKAEKNLDISESVLVTGTGATDKDGNIDYYAVDYNALLIMAIAKIKQLEERIEILEGELLNED